MRQLVVAVGTRMPAWVVAGFEQYAARLPRERRIELIEIKPEPRGAGRAPAQVLERERVRIEAALPNGCVRIILDQRGRQADSAELSRQWADWQARGRDLAFVIGGADGLAEPLKAGADARLALSRLTLPHGLVRVLLAEQLYRAYTICSGHPYHRA